MSRTIIIRLALAALFAAIAFTWSGGALLAEGWTQGYFLDVINRSNYSGNVHIQEADGSLHRIGSFSPYVEHRRFYSAFMEAGKRRIIFTYGKEGNAIQANTQIGFLTMPKFMTGRRIHLTDEVFKKQQPPTVVKVMAFDGRWTVGPESGTHVAVLRLTHRYSSHEMEGTITERQTGKKYFVDGKINGNGYTLFFHDKKEGKLELVCTLVIEAVPEKENIFHGNATLRWYDEDAKKYLNRNLPIAVRVSYTGKAILFSLLSK